jgi:hypothetical protein
VETPMRRRTNPLAREETRHCRCDISEVMSSKA